MEYKKVLITGGAGFIGSNFVRRILNEENWLVYNIDKLNYSSNLNNICTLEKAKTNHFHYKIDLAKADHVRNIVYKSDPDLIIHFAAESHVDRSIENPMNFIESNILGTFNLLESARDHYSKLSLKKKEKFKFIHVSTDEVYGSLGSNGSFDENSNYSPRSPYSASKAASDHLVKAWHSTYGLPTIISNCSNNFGPYQFPEKLIPLSILKALRGENINIYGDGQNVRDWLYVEDHIDALLLLIFKGEIGKSYCIGGFGEKTNNQIVNSICDLLDILKPKKISYSKQIKYVKDRPGHDKRYSINSNLIQSNLGWKPKFEFNLALKNTIEWYLKNLNWCNQTMENGLYKGERLGL